MWLGRFLDEIGRVIGREETHVQAALAFGEREEQDGLSVRVQSEKEIVHLLARKGFEAGKALRTSEAGPEIEEFIRSVEGMGDHQKAPEEMDFESAPGGESLDEANLSEQLYHSAGRGLLGFCDRGGRSAGRRSVFVHGKFLRVCCTV
jgi:hypothetical protein